MKASLVNLKSKLLVIASVSIPALTFAADALDFALNIFGLAALLS